MSSQKNLPPALAARLAKRGLLSSSSSSSASKIDNETKSGTKDVHNDGDNDNNDSTDIDDDGTKNEKIKQPQQQQQQKPLMEHEEEVIAEDYDETPTKQEFIMAKIIDTVSGCPNKYNIYHNCTNYCLKHYGNVSEEPPKKIIKAFQRLLKKYPLKDSVWEQVYEPGLQTYYFWNTETDQVSWLPPSHPDAKISMPAEKLRRLVRDDDDDEVDLASDKDGDDSDDDGNSDDEDDDDDDDDDDDSESDSDNSSNKLSSSSDDEEQQQQKKSKKIKKMRMTIERKNKLDPMDPAAYSNIPRGKWSDGLR